MFDSVKPSLAPEIGRLSAEVFAVRRIWNDPSVAKFSVPVPLR